VNRNGINLATEDAWVSVAPFADLRNLFRAPWGSAAKPYDTSIPLTQQNAAGYPTVDFGGFSIAAGQFKGVATWSQNGGGFLNFVGGIVPGSQTPTTVTIKGGEPVTFTYTGNNPGKAPTLITLVPAGTQATGPFRTDFVDNVVRPFGFVRYMDWKNTTFWNGVTWASGSSPTGLQTYEEYAKPTPGVAWELIIELANRTKTTPWVNIPTFADDDYIQQLATLLKAKLDPSLIPYVEYSNEPWNAAGAQQPFHTIHDILAPACKELLSDDEWTRIYEFVAFRLHRAYEIFGQVGQPCRPVLAGQAVATTWLERALAYSVKKFGDAKWIHSLAYAGYAQLPDGQVPTTLDGIFSALMASATNDHPKWKAAHVSLATQYGIGNVALYEAGQHLAGSSPLFVAAQDDPRMGDVYRAIAAAAGDVLINWYCSPGKYDGSGSWGWGQTVNDDTVKRRAIFGMAGYTPSPTPDPTPPPSLPGNGGNPTPGSNGAAVTLSFETPWGTFAFTPGPAVKVTGAVR
jgi:hypothetical protein